MADTPETKDQHFFDDPAIDRLTAAFLQLASEVWVLNERFAALQTLADEKGVITREDLARFQFTGEADAEIAKDRGAFLRRVVGPLTARD